ncbi:hypothetical protein, partial [Lentimicrobium sp.]|uniref:hypothetical protein n=1 Tax=Lentimicrobium sp. TaxID=2034841 RepID=UPI00345E9E68
MKSAQTVDFYLFIRSGRGASLSQHGCLNLTIVSFLKLSLHFFEYRPLKVNFRMPLLRKLKIFPLPYATGITKKKIEFYYELSASIP